MENPRQSTVEDPDDHQLFVVEGNPVAFYLYGTNEPSKRSALTPGQREKLARDIMVSFFLCSGVVSAGAVC